mmetsp:Transcript_103442/g.183768  ORF Transcript_103442/g.183768 Transcript_103442/m.183768 type:complete len:338 (+) Transcript_103442:300-1313(+)
MKSAALVQSVAQALSWAISDPEGHSSKTDSICRSFGASIPSLPVQKPRSIEETRQAATVFDSSAIPPISVDKYLTRLCSTFRCSDATFIAALIIVDRLLEYDGGRLPLTMRNVHRIFLASLLVSAKYNEDLVYSNGHYAKAGGVHLREVNRLERVLLTSLDFNLRIEPDLYQLYEDTLHTMSASRDPMILATRDGIPQKAEAIPPKVSPPAPGRTAQFRGDSATPPSPETVAGQEAVDTASSTSASSSPTETQTPEVLSKGETRGWSREENRSHAKERGRRGKELSAALVGQSDKQGDTTQVPWVQPQPRAILGLDPATLMAAAGEVSQLPEHPARG